MKNKYNPKQPLQKRIYGYRGNWSGATLGEHVFLAQRLNGVEYIQSVPRSKHNSVIKTSQLTLYREIIAVCSQIHTKHINTLYGQNVEFVNVKPVVHIVTTGVR
jgi:hypothetical protein